MTITTESPSEAPAIQRLPEVALALLPAFGRIAVSPSVKREEDKNVLIQDVGNRRLLWVTNNVLLCTLDLGEATGAKAFCLPARAMKKLKLPESAENFSIIHLGAERMLFTFEETQISLTEEYPIQNTRSVQAIVEGNCPIATIPVAMDPFVVITALNIFTAASKFPAYKAFSTIVKWSPCEKRPNLLTMGRTDVSGDAATGRISVWFMPIRQG